MDSLSVVNKRTGEVKSLLLDEITEVRSYRGTLEIIGTDNETYLMTTQVEQMAQLMPENFMIVDRGVIINLTNVQSFDDEGRQVILINGDKVSVSNNKIKEVKLRLNL